MDMRSQGWSGAAMLPYSELEYSGFRTSITNLVNKFAFRTNGHEPAKAPAKPVARKR